MSSGLFSSLALSSSIASSVIMGVQPPEAPDIPEQSVIQQNNDVPSHQSSLTSHRMNDSISSSAKDSDSSHHEDEVSSASKLLTGSSDTLDNLSQPHGIDISSHQHTNKDIDLSEVIKGGQDFTFVKATEGTGYVNPHFRSDVIDVMKENSPVGFYHYAKPSTSTEDAREQAQAFVSKTGIDKGVKSLPPVLDIEESNGVGNSEDLINWTQAFVDEIKDLTGQDVMIYTYPSFWQNNMGNTTQFSHLPLWIANYNGSTSPGTPLVGGWDDWTFWQYSSDGIVDGYDKLIDVNLFNGSSKELAEMYNSSQDKPTNASSGKKVSRNKSDSKTKKTVTKTVVVQQK